MSPRVFAPLLAILLVAAPLGAARADGFFDSGDIPVTQDGRVYLGFGASAYFFEGPRRSGLGALYEDNDPTIVTTDIDDFEPRDATGLVGLTAGYVVSPGGEGLLRNLRVDLTSHYFSTSDSKNVDRVMNGVYTDFLAIDGSGFVSDPVGPGETLNGSFDVEYDYVDLGLLARSDVLLGPCDAVLSPSFGVAVARLEEHHSIFFTNVSEAFQFDRIREDVETYYSGFTLGAQLRVPLFWGLSFRAGATTWLAWARAEYDASQQLFASDPMKVNADDVDGHFGSRTTGSAALIYERGPFVLSVSGGVDYWDYVPVIDYPAPPLGAMYNAVDRTEPAHIDADDMLNFFTGVTVAVRL